jgi:predicted AAA+ superfamily ATPase
MGKEVDLILEKDTGPLAIEIKSASKPDRSLLRGLQYWKKYQPTSQSILLYQGQSTSTENPDINFVCWKEIDSIR